MEGGMEWEEVRADGGRDGGRRGGEMGWEWKEGRRVSEKEGWRVEWNEWTEDRRRSGVEEGNERRGCEEQFSQR